MTAQQQKIWAKCTEIMKYCRSVDDCNWVYDDDKQSIIQSCVNIRWVCLEEYNYDAPELMKDVNRRLKKNFKHLDI
jgi:hypothetical protein